VTVCSAGRLCIFGEVVDSDVRLSPAGEVVASEWREIGIRWGTVSLDVFVVMPNHLHGIVWLHGAGQDPPYQPWSVSSSRARRGRSGGRSGNGAFMTA